MLKVNTKKIIILNNLFTLWDGNFNAVIKQNSFHWLNEWKHENYKTGNFSVRTTFSVSQT